MTHVLVCSFAQQYPFYGELMEVVVQSSSIMQPLRAIPEKNTWGGKTAGDIFFYGWSVRTFFKLYGSLVFDKF